MLHPLTALGALVLSWLVVRAAAWLRWHWALAPLPKPHGHWLGGQLAALANPRPHRTLLAWTQELGAFYLLRVFWLQTVVVSDPALVHALLKRSGDPDKTRKVYTSLDKLLGGPSLASASTTSPYWRAVRKGIAPAFNMRSLRAGFQHVQAGGAELVALLHERGPEQVVDMDLLLQRLSLDITGRVGFNFDFGSLSRARPGGDASIAQAYGVEGGGGDADMMRNMSLALLEVTKRSTNPLRALAAYLPGKTGAEVRAGERAWRLFNKHMRQLLCTIKERGPPVPDDVSIAAHLLRLEDPVTGGPLSDERLLPEISTLFAAGIDTTAHSMAWTLYLVAQHPEVEAKLCEELRGLSLLATPESLTPRQVAFEDIGRLPYLTAVVKESMRMLPVLANVTSITFPHDIELRGHRIPAGTNLWLHMFSAHNSSQYWEEPERFDPDRFLQPGAEYWDPAAGESPAAGQEGRSHPNGAPPRDEQGNGQGATGSLGRDQGDPRAAGARPQRFFPFSLGARDCVGQNLARLTYTATLATLWGNFTFRLAAESAGPGGVRDVILVTLQPENGVNMVAIPRASLSA